MEFLGNSKSEAFHVRVCSLGRRLVVDCLLSPFCARRTETDVHVLVEYEFAMEVWEPVGGGLRFGGEFLLGGTGWPCWSDLSMELLHLAVMVLWSLWKERCCRVL